MINLNLNKERNELKIFLTTLKINDPEQFASHSS